MFKIHFRLFHEKFYIISFFITLISLFLPWLGSFIFSEANIIGIRFPFGVILFAFLSLNAMLSFIFRKKEGFVSILNIILGILCLGTVIAAFIIYNIAITISLGTLLYGIGMYVAVIGSLGIIISGILGIRDNRKKITSMAIIEKIMVR